MSQTIPTPDISIPGFAAVPKALQKVIALLSRPWLNDAIGPNNGHISLHPWGKHQIIARLEAFGGLLRKESTGNATGEANGAQEAEVQGKKRVCAEGLMLGLSSSFLPPVWGKGEHVGKDFSFADGEERRCVWDLYRRAGLISSSTPGVTLRQAMPKEQRTQPSAQTSSHTKPPSPPTPRKPTPAATPSVGARPCAGSCCTCRRRAERWHAPSLPASANDDRSVS